MNAPLVIWMIVALMCGLGAAGMAIALRQPAGCVHSTTTRWVFAGSCAMFCMMGVVALTNVFSLFSVAA
ncbi:hypothetical protein ACT3TS_17475 [Specibacter sp. AOP5-B1-6]|uniref:hypothetical protein n=1 Tax=Specibacter sp. AOP5-B1-6 TaxID=3457653 RepID=UPI00402B6D6C